MTEKKQKSPIAERSKKWIAKALLELMKSKPYDDITIKEITTKADLVRRTFYRNFSSKNDILTYYSNLMAKQFTERVNAKGEITIIEMVRVFFDQCSQYMEFLVNLKLNNLWLFSQNQYREIYDYILATMKREAEFRYPDDEIEYYAEFITGGLWKLFCRWVEDGAKKSPEDMTALVGDIVERMKLN